MNAYRQHWDNHVKRVGAVRAVTRWDEYQYLSFYREILSDLKGLPVKVVADVGCGPAIIHKLLVELWGNIDYHGYDVSEGMIHAALGNVPYGQFHLVGETLAMWPKADLILCHSVFTHIFPDDTLQYLKTFSQALTTNGVISASIHSQFPDRGGDWYGGVARIDISPAYFEGLVDAAGLRVSSFVDAAVPAGPVRYYRLTL